MAQNDLINASIEWRDLVPVLALTFEGMATGGILTPGFAEYVTPIGNTLITLTLDYEGFSDGLPVTRTKTLYPTKTKRIRVNGVDDPLNLPDDITVSGSDIIVRFALDNYVYAACSNGSLNISSGVYTVGGVPNNPAIGFPVINNVVGVPYPTIKANYTVPVSGLTTLFNPYTLTKDTTGNFEVSIYSDGNEFIDCIKVTATGATSGVSQTITAIKKVDETDRYNDALPFPEYIATIPYDVYTQGEIINITPVVYPKFGNNPLDFSTLGNTMPTAEPCVQSIVCDKDGSYGYSVAVVSTTGDDGSGAVVNFDDFNPSSPPTAFLTRGAAYQALFAYNETNFGRVQDAGGGIVYMQPGSYDLQGVAQANRNNTSNMVTAPFPGVSRSQVEFVSNNFDDRGPDTYDMMSNITINMPGDGPCYTYIDNLIMYNCEISVGTLMYTATSAGALNIISGLITRIDQGLLPSAGSAYSVRLRGLTCTHSSSRQLIESEIAVGCNFDDVLMRLKNSSAGVVRNGGIFCYNRIVSSDDRRLIDMDEPSTNGFAINNNIIVNQTEVELLVEPIVFIGADNSPIDAFNDFMFCNNTVPGSQRCNLFYNDFNLAGVGPGPRLLNRIQNNLYGTMNIITDDDDHGGGPLDATDGDRYGNHALVHGTWNNGNYGLGIGRNTTPPEGGHKNRYVIFDWEYAGFVDDRVGHPGITATGDGDYHLTEGAGAIGWPYERVMDYDLDGNIRPSVLTAGAYAFISGNGNRFINSQSMSGFMQELNGGLN